MPALNDNQKREMLSIADNSFVAIGDIIINCGNATSQLNGYILINCGNATSVPLITINCGGA